MNAEKKKPGRPKDSTNADDVQQELSRCEHCKSTRRSRYRNRTVQEFTGLDLQGRPFTAIIRRNTACLDCGQSRVDRQYWYSLIMPNPEEPAEEEE